MPDEPQHFSFSFGGPPDPHQQELAITAHQVLRWSVEEFERLYAEQAETAKFWNDQLTADDITAQTCIAGLIRNSAAKRTAKACSQRIAQFDPEKSHHYQAFAYDHGAAFARWQARLGKLTGLEHTHAPDPPHAPDGPEDGPKTPLPDWLK